MEFALHSDHLGALSEGEAGLDDRTDKTLVDPGAQRQQVVGVVLRCDDQAEFEFSLDLLLDGLERHRAAGRG